MKIFGYLDEGINFAINTINHVAPNVPKGLALLIIGLVCLGVYALLRRFTLLTITSIALFGISLPVLLHYLKGIYS